MSEEKRKGKMTVAEAGRLGGEKTSETHGTEYYSEIGSIGGRKVASLFRKEKSTKKNRNNENAFFWFAFFIPFLRCLLRRTVNRFYLKSTFNGILRLTRNSAHTCFVLVSLKTRWL